MASSQNDLHPIPYSPGFLLPTLSPLPSFPNPLHHLQVLSLSRDYGISAKSVFIGLHEPAGTAFKLNGGQI